MKNFYSRTFLLSFFALLLAWTAHAQIPNDSPVPVDVIIDIPETGFTRLIESGTDPSDYTSVSNSTEWGIQPLRETVSGEIVWVDDDDIAGDGLDSLGCDTSSMADYTGKMVLIRRGACFFSDKIYFAQEAGAIGVLIINADGSDVTGGMAAGDEKALDITIPAVFLQSAAIGESFIPQLEAGETVVATFRVRGFFGELGPNAYATPQNQITAFDSIQVDLLNLSAEEDIVDAEAKVDIIAPDGTTTTLTATAAEIKANETFTFEFDDYTPSELGLYEMIYSNSVTSDTIRRNFEVSEFTFQIDNGNIPVWPVDSWIAPTSETFINTYSLIYDFGNLFHTSTEALATYATFSLGNPDSLFTGDELADEFLLTLFDTDPDGDGVGAQVDDIDYSTYEIVASVPYILTGEEEPYELLTVEFEAPVPLKANGQYLLMAQYNGVFAALGTPPWYTYAGQEPYPGFSTMVFGDRLYTGGWSGDFHAVVRLHTEGFTPVGTVYSPLPENSVQLMPNPASDYLNVQVALEESARNVHVRILDLMGKEVARKSYNGIQSEFITFNTSQLPAGTYFLAVNTEKGYRTKKFVVTK